ncbi:MAG: hypothetical protein ACTMIA_15815 [Vibrio sp.]
MTPEQDKKHLQQSLDLAEKAKQQGIHPFAAILVNAQGEVLLKEINGVSVHRGILTYHV